MDVLFVGPVMVNVVNVFAPFKLPLNAPVGVMVTVAYVIHHPLKVDHVIANVDPDEFRTKPVVGVETL